eukprot:6103962-Pyramimonas_sp.AAC.1
MKAAPACSAAHGGHARACLSGKGHRRRALADLRHRQRASRLLLLPLSCCKVPLAARDDCACLHVLLLSVLPCALSASNCFTWRDRWGLIRRLRPAL